MKIKSELDIFIIKYPHHTKLKKEVLKYLDNYPVTKNECNSVKASITGWNISTPQIKILKNYIIENIKTFYPIVADKDFKFVEFWANIYNKGDFAEEHDHVPWNFSVAYFLKSKINYSSLIFDNKKVLPMEGFFALFPSILDHHVPPHNCDDQRITLSGNISYK